MHLEVNQFKKSVQKYENYILLTRPNILQNILLHLPNGFTPDHCLAMGGGGSPSTFFGQSLFFGDLLVTDQISKTS